MPQLSIRRGTARSNSSETGIVTDVPRKSGPDSFFTGLAQELDTLTGADNSVFVVDQLAVHVHRAAWFDAKPVGQTVTDFAQRHAGDRNIFAVDVGHPTELFPARGKRIVQAAWASRTPLLQNS
jgi:hypothetical protein